MTASTARLTRRRPALLERSRDLARRAEPFAPVAVAVLLVIPSLVFVTLDRSVWRWDDSWYGEVSIDLWATLRNTTRLWPDAMVHAFGIKPPAIAWIGQFFVPLRRIVGDVQVALRLSVVLAQAGSLLFIYVAARRLRVGTVPVLSGVLLAAGSPLFVDLSHYYFVEELQTFSLAWMVFIMVSARHWHPALTVAQIVAAASFGLLVKISTPVYMAAPALGALGLSVAAWRDDRRPGSLRERRLIASAALAAILAVGAADWYRVNWSLARQNTEFSTTSSLLGTHHGFGSRFWYWLGELGRSLFLPRFVDAMAAVLLGGVAYALLRRRSMLRGFDAFRFVCLLASVTAALVVVTSLALQSNEQDRFLLALFPCLALALVAVLGAIRSRWVAFLSVGILAAQFGLVTDWSYSPPSRIDFYFKEGLPLGPPAAKTAFATQLDRIAQLTCSESRGRTSVVGTDYPWLNHNNLELLAHEKFAERGLRCTYAGLGFLETDAAKVWRAIDDSKPPFYIGVDYGNPANPLPRELTTTVSLLNVYNVVNVEVFRHVMKSGLYTPVPGMRRLGLIVLRARPS